MSIRLCTVSVCFHIVRAELQQRPYKPEKTKIFTLWTLKEKVC